MLTLKKLMQTVTKGCVVLDEPSILEINWLNLFVLINDIVTVLLHVDC